MPDGLSIALAQLNFTIGDFEGNTRRIVDAWRWAEEQGADMVVFPECCVSGYPPEDLVLLPRFQELSMEAVEQLREKTKGSSTAMLIGSPWKEEGKLYNAAFILEDGKFFSKHFKYDLPNYGVFDEKRVFHAGQAKPYPLMFRGVKIGVLICEEMWNSTLVPSLKDAEILISVNGSPFEQGKSRMRMDRALTHSREGGGRPLMYVNQVCGHDDLVFDGGSFVLSHESRRVIQMPYFEEQIRLLEWKEKNGTWICNEEKVEEPEEEALVYEAMMLGLKDYVEKNGFPGVVLGLSGGVDSALTAAVAADALGADKVHAVMMPSRYTSQESLQDAKEKAQRMGLHYHIIPIEPAVEVFEQMLSPLFTGKPKDITEENIQSRIRGLLLMALSNKLGYMVVATGNKSEMSVGYATLYGDMCGGYSVLKDVYKEQVYRLSRWRNANVPVHSQCRQKDIIPENVLVKAPTAELRHGQKDEDSLPPYNVLDTILMALIEENKSPQGLVQEGFDKKTVEKVASLLYAAEYKRRQSPPGVKISGKPFGRDRRYPITTRFRGN